MDPTVELAQAPPRPTRLDIAVTGLLLVWAVLEAFAAPAEHRLAALLFGVGATVPLLFRRRHLVPVLAVVSAVVLARAVTADADEAGAAPFPGLLVLAFSAGVHVVPRLRSALAASVPALVMAVLMFTGYYGADGRVRGMVILAFFVGGAWALGRAVLRAVRSAESERSRAVEQAQEAVEQERARIARELHDVVAHSISVIVLQAGAAATLAESDPRTARGHMETVRRTGREALNEMRHLLAVLREGEAAYRPQPTIDRIPDLVAALEEEGTAVRLSLDTGDGLPTGVELCAYRVVQESLTNARKHAAGAAVDVDVVRTPDELRVRVHTGRSPDAASASEEVPGAEQGLLGMRERVQLYGGTLRAGPDADGFTVEARIPLEEL